MYDKRMLNEYVLPALQDEFLGKINILSVYLTGSFINEGLWIPAVSDIDVIILTDTDIAAKGSIDITERCKDYIKERNWEYIYDFHADSLIELSYAIWNVDEINDVNSWERYVQDEYKIKIIEDQLMLTSQKCLVHGKDLFNVYQLDPFFYRKYLKCCEKTNNQEDITLLKEIKRIISSIRIYYYLWSGSYIYHMDELKNAVEYDNNIYEILSEAIRIKKAIAVEHDINIKSNDYIKRNMKMYKSRIKLQRELIALDKKFCDEHGTVHIKNIPC